MNNGRYGFVFAVVYLTACQAAVSTGTSAQDSRSNPSLSEAPADGESGAVQIPALNSVPSLGRIEARISKDMAYADLRKVAMEEGWTPTWNPECKKNVGGEARICEQLPELQSCSGDGYCVMKFRNESLGRAFNVTTYGMRGDWNVTGADSRLNVIEWEFVQ